MNLIIALLLVMVMIAGCKPKIDESKIALTEKELAYIAGHPSVAWAVEENRPPYIFVEGGSPAGLAPEYISVIARKTGLKFYPVKTGSFESSIEALRSGKVEVMTSIRPTPESAEFMGFTPPFASQAGVFIFRINTLSRSPLTTGILKNSAAKKYLLQRFPDMNLIETADDEQSTVLLKKGLIDGWVTDTGSAAHLTKKIGVETRSVIINFDYPYSMAYRRENTVLGSILTKAIASITPEDKIKLNRRWLAEEK